MNESGVRWIPCGDYANQSERDAVERLRRKLQAAGDNWILLSNLNHSPHPGLRSDEIDLIAIGPSGVFVIEIKHWDTSYLRQKALVAEQEAERINAKAKRVAAKLRQQFDPGFVTARLLLTRGDLRFDAGNRPQPRGVAVFGLPEYRELLAVDDAERLTVAQIEWAAKWLEPATKLALSGDLRAFAGLINLERLSDKDDAFHRVYRGQHPTRRDRVILHLYDLSASSDKQAEKLARREFDTIQRWQKSPFVPSLLDSFQEADGYPGELFFFSLVDPAAPTLTQRCADPTWDTVARLDYVRAALNALAQFHQPREPDQTQLLHRHITPDSLRVRYNGQPLFTDFSLSRLEDTQSIGSVAVDFGAIARYVAPEIQAGGLAAATVASDTYAICATLVTLFEDSSDPLAEKTKRVLLQGCIQEDTQRPTLAELAEQLVTPSATASKVRELPAPEFWDEDTLVPFQHSHYKIISRLGKGGIGQTFKVVEVDAHSNEKFGTYVAKLIRQEADGKSALHAYRKVRDRTTHSNLSTIHEIAPEWAANGFVALLKWVEGMPLQDLVGVLPLYAEDLGESAENLVLRWLIELCAALGELHCVGLVHGDVSPRNLIVQGGTVVLTDYDTVCEAGSRPRGGTPPYASPTVQKRSTIQPADDVYALAASFVNAH